MYIVDADILIRAKNQYYQFKRVPEFWDWLAHQAENGKVGMPIETWKKIGNKPREQRDDLADWANGNKETLVIKDQSYQGCFPKVLVLYQWPNGRKFTNDDLDCIGDDFQLIACAHYFGATLISNEVSAKTNEGPNRKVPDVCADLNVPCADLDGAKGQKGLIDLLDFSTSWNK